MSEILKEELLLKSDQIKKSDTRPLFACEAKNTSSNTTLFKSNKSLFNVNQKEKTNDDLNLEVNNINDINNAENSNTNPLQIKESNNQADYFNSSNNTNNISILANLNEQKQQISFLFTSEKAGMEGLDRDQINKIILECTKNSTITKKKQEEYDMAVKVVDDWKIKLQSLHKNSLIYEQNRKLAEMKMREIQNTRDLSRIWMHIDMDMFYAAIEIRDNPSLKDIPIAVGNESMICTSNYIARKFGVRSAMPGFIGKRLCPQLKFIPPNMEKYKKDSEKIMNVLREYDKNLDIRGLDEAFLDLTPYCKENYVTTHGELESIIMEIKFKIFNETKLTCSIGISSNKMLAKICSDKNKPDGFFKLLTDNPDEIMMFMSNMNIRKVPFVGEKSEQKLNLLGIKTCNDFLERFVDLFYILQDNTWEFLITSCFGIGSVYHEENKDPINKSISCSETFKMTNDINKIRTVFETLVKRLYNLMLEDQVMGKNLGLEIKDKNDRTNSKSTSLKKYFETETEIREKGWNTLYSMIQNTSIRLVRVKMSGLTHINPEQLRKKKDKPIMKFLGKMNNVNESKKSLSTTNNADNLPNVKNDDMKSSKINNIYVNDSDKENLIGGKSNELIKNARNKKNEESSKLTKENIFLNMFAIASPSKPKNTIIEGGNDKPILKTRDKFVHNDIDHDSQIEKNKDNLKLNKTRTLIDSKSKDKSPSKRSKKNSNIEPGSNNFYKLNDMLFNMKAVKKVEKANNNISDYIQEDKRLIDFNQKNVNLTGGIKEEKHAENELIDEFNTQRRRNSNSNKKNNRNVETSNDIRKKNNSKGKKKKTKASSNNHNQIKIDTFLKKN